MKKGQISGIILMVVMLAVIFGIMYYLSIAITEKKTEAEITKTLLSQSRIDPIKEYVTSCISIVGKQALELLAQQGGFIYKSQGGLIQDPLPAEIGIEFIPYREKSILFGVKKPEQGAGPFSYVLPTYPWERFPEVTKEENIIKLYVGFYGYQTIPPLKGPSTQKNSIQEQLEEFISKNLPNCLDLSQFEHQNLQIQTKQIKVSTKFTEKKTIFSVDYPITIRDKNTNAQAELSSFKIDFDVDMLELYNFISIVTEKDASDISFNLDLVESPRINIERDRDVYDQDDVVIFTDSESKLVGTPYFMRIGFQNRPPALELLDGQQNKNLLQSFEICGAYNQDGDYLPPIIDFDSINRVLHIRNPRPQCSSPLELPIIALDPDEDIPNFVFELGNKDISLPYQIPEKYIGNPLKLKIKINDKEFTDWQTLTFKTYFVGSES